MKKPSFFCAATIVQSWFEGKMDSIQASKTRKSKNLSKDRHCCLIKIPYVHPLMRMLSLKPPISSGKKHTFQRDSACSLHLTVDSPELQTIQTDSEEGCFSKNVVNKPLKEHLLAAKRLEQASQQQQLLSRKSGLYTVSLFSNKTAEEPLPPEWILQRKEERQFQVDRVIKHP